KALYTIANAPRDDAEALFLSADRFGQAETPIPLTNMEREHLLDRFGLFGVRLAVALIRQGAATTATALSSELVRRSGLNELKDVLLSQFAARRDVLKARSALLALEAVLQGHRIPGRDVLATELERITSGAHEFAEIRLLNALRAGGIKVKPAEAAEMERLLGAEGGAIHTRLGLSPEADVSEVRRARTSAIGRWQRRAESPMSSREVADAARVVIRTCAGLLVSLGSSGPEAGTAGGQRWSTSSATATGVPGRAPGPPPATPRRRPPRTRRARRPSATGRRRCPRPTRTASRAVAAAGAATGRARRAAATGRP